MIFLGASVTGRLHLFREANAQDAFALARAASPRRGGVGVVCDGCGAEPRSEIGATLLARALATATGDALAAGERASAIAPHLGAFACETLAAITQAATGGRGVEAFVREHLLTTALVLIDDGETLAITAWGDGLIALEDEVLVIDEGGVPAYLAYALLDRGAPPPPSFACTRPSASVRRAAIATDGLAPALLAGAFGHRGRGLQRWLNVQARGGTLDDDATVVVRELAEGGAS